jgi:CRP-like cAMP-binding protein
MTTQEMPVLGAQPFLRDMPADQLAQLAALCQHITVPAEHRLLGEGTPAHRFWLIDTGQVTIDVTVPGHGLATVDTLGHGDIVGLSALAPPYECRFGALTTRPTLAFEFDAMAVHAACSVDPCLAFELAWRLAAELERRMDAARSQLMQVYKQAQLASSNLGRARPDRIPAVAVTAPGSAVGG